MKYIFFFLLFVLVKVEAAQSLSTKVRSSYSSIRALGMGNAFTAVADDYSLIFYNPAGFARKPYNEFQISLVGAGVSAKSITIANDIKKASDTVGSDSAKAQAISDVLDQYYGQSLGGKLQALELFWVRQKWGIALLPADLTVDITVNKQLGPAIDLNVIGDTTAAFGYGTGLTKDIDAGLTLKYVHRVSVQQSVSALELATNPNVLSQDRFNEGTTFDFDLGFMWTPSWFTKKIRQQKIVETKVADPVVENKAVEEKAVEVKPTENDKTKAESEAVVVEDKAAVQKPVEEVGVVPQPDVKPIEEKREPQSEEAKATEVANDKSQQVEAAPTITPSTTPPPVASPEVKEKEAELKIEKVDVPVVPADLEIKDYPVVKAEETENTVPTYPLSFGLVVHNVLAGNFSLSKQVNKSAVEVPAHLERVIDVGTQYKIVNGEDFKIRLLFDIRNILHPEISVQKALHAGIEFDYSPSGWFKTQLRGGLNQSYYTAGATLLLAVLNIDVATYGEEVGTASNKIENRVTAAKVSFNF